jgi:hypothetical protein
MTAQDLGAGEQSGPARQLVLRKTTTAGLWFRSQDRPARGRRGEIASRLGE